MVNASLSIASFGFCGRTGNASTVISRPLGKRALEMRDFRDAKLMAQSLKKALSEKSIASSHGECLDLISQAFGFTGWNVLAAKIDTTTAACSLCGKTPPHLVDI